ncbi:MULTISPECIES: response regulator transcription factor [Arcicella]|uniref:Response regulator transcription factor n=1 Tax=Arcicella aquatica TaxID=217141 RepID=A0ABU5QRE8_9BACT|nr:MULTISPECIES: response regulator transcription factor [Arcicella]MDR6561536.1 two-component system alkaline phosphatase synthesis response regulator PhoP [Arcicella sp. BE51]MDR6811420.1 two-component system alkaline phosphatase synthesis response regulator PhoP [Arcicella sp. BE140]MDR6822770.1 two-component system alkaline phosphatase synthesis response regulator PhoP [Arcicella sp. BE139]MEA5259672.1 response regulator transcription factor [Arcicella aquatica]
MIDLSLKILLVDDDPDILELLEYNLQKEGFQTRTAENGLQGIQVAQEFLPDMILMDIMMPIMDGIEAGRIIKQSKELKNSYLIFLTARTEEYSEVAAFDIGANDYIIKPVKPRALISRIKAVFQRNIADTVDEEKVVLEDLIINRQNYSIAVKESSWTLPKKEFDLLMFFVSNPNKVYTRDEILSSVWGKGIHVTERTVDVHIRKIREKIGEDYIRTIKGVGYLFSRN